MHLFIFSVFLFCGYLLAPPAFAAMITETSQSSASPASANDFAQINHDSDYMQESEVPKLVSLTGIAWLFFRRRGRRRRLIIPGAGRLLPGSVEQNAPDPKRSQAVHESGQLRGLIRVLGS